jgi:hypothetical protein
MEEWLVEEVYIWYVSRQGRGAMAGDDVEDSSLVESSRDEDYYIPYGGGYGGSLYPTVFTTFETSSRWKTPRGLLGSMLQLAHTTLTLPSSELP